MYGMNATLPASGAAALAYTGLNVGSSLLTALGVLLIGVAMLSLLRKNSKARP
ncbi:LPXTG cell wall anchor domain-containing protein [Pseudarthrobacter sp. SL88]|uniref:LPXTG cell wall anchor domain-containing protein n=1 Tax=Pseudarthrobacter sp. SL88 TaxID=2994666 RepID=UPI0022746BA2|nr:LPXTG cell wall anchor domain-containing protein [Pseudarthrobacter sp. SL88]MCY1673792.1 LPXTG cell wall anchor domain-containing protein [Pseudarthrobacter sp. SL88]